MSFGLSPARNLELSSDTGARRWRHRELRVGRGLIGFPGIGIYVASKHAVIGLTKNAALEYSAQGIRIKAVNPAVIDTEMVDRVAAGANMKRTIFPSCIPSGVSVKSRKWPRPFCGSVQASRLL